MHVINPDIGGLDFYIQSSDYVCGDANEDGTINIGDAVFILNSVFQDGPLPAPGCCIPPGYCLINDILYATGEDNPSNPCQECMPSWDKTNWSNQPNGTPCLVPHASYSECHNGECVPGVCDPGWENCNGISGDGCEVNTDSDENNCGGCEIQCPPGATCVNGVCVP